MSFFCLYLSGMTEKSGLDKDGLTGGEVRTLSVRVIGHLRKTEKY